MRNKVQNPADGRQAATAAGPARAGGRAAPLWAQGRLDSIRINVLGDGPGDCARLSGQGEVKAGWV